MQLLTGPEIQQLSMHGILARLDRCWCCGSIRTVRIVGSKLTEVCILTRKPSCDDKHVCQYLVLENDSNGDFINFCITPYTDMGNCSGMVAPIVSVERFCEIYDDIENLDISDRTLKVISIVNNEIHKRCRR